MKQITKTEKWTYTGSLLGQNMIYSFVTMYVMFFFTDLLRIPSQSVTVIMVTASLWTSAAQSSRLGRPSAAPIGWQLC